MAANTEFVLAEDEALKTKLSSLRVSSTRGVNGTTDVKVWYRWPEREYGDAIFPFITLDLIDTPFDGERAHSYAYDEMAYLPDDTPADGTSTYIAPYPEPVMLRYIVATHCRSSRHDRELHRQLMQPDFLPWKCGYLLVPTDDTIRRLDVYDVSSSTDYDSLKKRVFRRIWTIGISAEMLPENWTQPAPPITNTFIDVVPS